MSFLVGDPTGSQGERCFEDELPVLVANANGEVALIPIGHLREDHFSRGRPSANTRHPDLRFGYISPALRSPSTTLSKSAGFLYGSTLRRCSKE